MGQSKAEDKDGLRRELSELGEGFAIQAYACNTYSGVTSFRESGNRSERRANGFSQVVFDQIS